MSVEVTKSQIVFASISAFMAGFCLGAYLTVQFPLEPITETPRVGQWVALGDSSTPIKPGDTIEIAPTPCYVGQVHWNGHNTEVCAEKARVR